MRALLHFQGYFCKITLKAYISFFDLQILKKPCHRKKIDDLFFPLVCTIKNGAVNVGSLSVKNYQVLKVMPYGISCKLTRKLEPRHTKWSRIYFWNRIWFFFIILPSKKCRQLTFILILSKFYSDFINIFLETHFIQVSFRFLNFWKIWIKPR